MWITSAPNQFLPRKKKPATTVAGSSLMGATGLEPVAPNEKLIRVIDNAITAIREALSLVRVGSQGADDASRSA